METVEIVVYIIVALIAGSMILYVLTTVRTDRNLAGDTQFSFTEEEFYPKLITLWKECGLGTRNATYRVHVKSGSNITKEEVLQYLRKYNQEDLLKEENLNMSDMDIPTIIQIRCKAHTLTLSGG